MRHTGNLLAAKLLKKHCTSLSVRLRNDWVGDMSEPEMYITSSRANIYNRSNGYDCGISY